MNGIKNTSKTVLRGCALTLVSLLAACQSTRPAPTPAPVYSPPVVQPVYVPPVYSPPPVQNAPSAPQQAMRPPPVQQTYITPPPPFTQSGNAGSPAVGKIVSTGNRNMSGAQLAAAAATHRFVIVGEQHDHPDHQALAAWLVEQLAAQGKLAALALEMLEGQGEPFALPRNMQPWQVRNALQWAQRGQGFAFERYEAIIMAAVRAGVPIVAANLPRNLHAQVMQDAALDSRLSANAAGWMNKHIVEGHCGLLAKGQVPGMMRVQIARDRQMAQAMRQNARANQTVLLVTGTVHADRGIGVPVQLAEQSMMTVIMAGVLPNGQAPAQNADMLWVTPATPPKDYCKDVRDGLVKPGRSLQIK